MQQEIQSIATVIAGHTFRGAIEASKDGSVYVFQAKNLIQGGPFTEIESLTRLSRNPSGYTGYIKRNDVLLVARGMRSGTFRSTIFTSDALNVIPSSSVHIIRITNNNVLPEYLSHYLNSEDGQAALSLIVSGSYMGVLPRKKLEQIKIPVPSIQMQEAIINLYKNIREQQKILNRKMAINENIINATFKHLVTP